MARSWQCHVVSRLFHGAASAGLEMEQSVLALHQALELQH